MRRILEALGSGVIVYAIFAACGPDSPPSKGAATEPSAPSERDAGMGSAQMQPPATTSTHAQDPTTPLPGFMDPVPAAMALESESGSRLVVTWWKGSDGLRAYRGFRDSALGFDCTVARTVDGIARCMPVRFATLYYSDDKCTKPALLLLPESALSTTWDSGNYASVFDTATNTVTAYQLAAPQTQAAWTGTVGSCVASDELSGLRTATRVPDADLAELSVAVE